MWIVDALALCEDSVISFEIDPSLLAILWKQLIEAITPPYNK